MDMLQAMGIPPLAAAPRGEQGVPALEAGKFYILTPTPTAVASGGESRVLGPFDQHVEAWMARNRWAYASADVADRAEIMTGAELERDYCGRHGTVVA